jgi:RNA polymerase sigma factor (sigma-70 family)
MNEAAAPGRDERGPDRDSTSPSAPPTDKPAVTDAELIARCRGGDQSAWEALVRRHSALVAAIVRGGFRLSPADAEDVFQEVFTRLYVRLGSIREGDAVRGWIAQVARNAALDQIRRRGREVVTGEPLDESAFDEPLRGVEEALSVRAALAQLPAHQQEILDRFFARDESYDTIGAELGIPPGTIASRISRALAALRVAWETAEGRSHPAGASTK